ncbi:MAG: ketopantoate reductase family protein [Tenericutes bacterium]|nr:ketopantoate reductase family protein [Mycoplasmatota bacterium]
MKVAIYGAGSMGTILGAYISKAGYQIDLVSRNTKHIDSLKKYGANIVGKTVFTQQVTALLPEEMMEKYDIILLMTKQLDNKAITKSLLPYLEVDGVICTMQNGLPEISVSEVIGKDRTFGCAMSWGATLIKSGTSELTSEATRESLTFSIGKFGDNDDTKFNYVVELLNTMGEVVIEKNFVGARWAKLLVNAAFSGLSVVTGGNFGEISKNKKSRKLAQMIMKECIDVCRKDGIKIEPIQGKNIGKLMDYNNPIKRWLSFMIIPLAMKKHKLIKSSMLGDLEKGRNCEIEAINGVVCNYGNKVGIETPVNDRVVKITHEIEKKKYRSEWKNLDLFKDLL